MKPYEEELHPTNWPFPPLTGAVPWTPKQIKEYELNQRAQQQDALF